MNTFNQFEKFYRNQSAAKDLVAAHGEAFAKQYPREFETWTAGFDHAKRATNSPPAEAFESFYLTRLASPQLARAHCESFVANHQAEYAIWTAGRNAALNSSLAAGEQPCECLTCRPLNPADPGSVRMAVCPSCGDKRCPHVKNHRNACTGGDYTLNALIEERETTAFLREALADQTRLAEENLRRALHAEELLQQDSASDRRAAEALLEQFDLHQKSSGAAHGTQRLRPIDATAPREIFLNVSDEQEHTAEEFPRHPHADEVTWSAEHAALVCAVRYVRADLANRPLAAPLPDTPHCGRRHETIHTPETVR